MGPQNLPAICPSAFAAFFLLLAFLSLVMKIIIALFPQKAAQYGAAILGDVTTTVMPFTPEQKLQS